MSNKNVLDVDSCSNLGIGKPDDVFTSERLMQAYGGHMRFIQTGDGLLALSDTCCGKGHE